LNKEEYGGGCYKAGDYLAIDLSMTIFESHLHTFGLDEDKPLVHMPLEESQIVEKKDSNGNFIEYVFTAVGFLGEIGENRERRYEIMQDIRASNYARLRQTSYDMLGNVQPLWTG
jgi:hypothetical protein